MCRYQKEGSKHKFTGSSPLYVYPLKWGNENLTILRIMPTSSVVSEPEQQNYEFTMGFYRYQRHYINSGIKEMMERTINDFLSLKDLHDSPKLAINRLKVNGFLH